MFEHVLELLTEMPLKINYKICDDVQERAYYISGTS